MNPSLLVAFWGTAFLLIVVPGPDWAFILAAGTRHRFVVPAVTGLMIGYTLLTGLVAAGVGALVSRSAILLTVLTLAGAGYLIYLGAGLLRRHRQLHAEDTSNIADANSSSADPSVPPVGARSYVLRGIGVSGLNPKGLLIFVALLPQFTDPHGTWSLSLQMVALGLIFVLTCGGFYAIVGYSARTLLSTRPNASRLISRISGAGMILIALLLLLERILNAR